MSTPNIVPWQEAELPKHTVTLHNGLSLDLKDGRTVTVFRVSGGEGGIGLRFRRPTTDGKVSELAFGLTNEAALALMFLLDAQFRATKSEPDTTSSQTETA